jgi:hypothetical protein
VLEQLAADRPARAPPAAAPARIRPPRARHRQRALAPGDVEAILAAFEPDGAAPGGGLAVYLRGDRGRLAAARVYDDSDPPLSAHAYDEWRGRGAEFLTPRLDNQGYELRCYLRVPDGRIIEVGQATGFLEDLDNVQD